MNTSTHRGASTAPGDPDPDASLGALIDGLVDRLGAGEPVDLESVVRDHPGHESQLRGLFPALEMMAALGRSVDRGAAGSPPPPPGGDPRLGSGVLGDYRIAREVGRGGMGVVFEAVQVSLGRRVALKILPMAAAVDPRHLGRFRLEAQAAAHLHHPHIVPIHAVGSDRGVHYYAMQFIDGRSLAELARDSPRGPARLAARLVAQAAEALEHAHALGVLHRDVKPANLLVEPSGHLWVADFGLARFGAESDLTRTGDLLGTLRYMSPERLTAGRPAVDHRADIYGLGATLYELLAGRPAFDGPDRQELIRRIAHEDPTPPRRLDPAIPRDLETVVLKAMAKEPEGRYATAGDLAEDLHRFLRDEPILARRPGPAGRLARWSRRHRVALGSAAAALVIALAVGSALLWHQGRQTAREKERAQRAYAQNRKVLDLVFSRQEQVNLRAMALITRANGRGLGEDGSYVRMVRDFYQELIDQAGDDPEMAELKARSYHRVGFCRMALRDVAGAEDAYRRAVDLFEGLLARSPGNTSIGWLLASALGDRGMLRRFVGQRPGSESDYRRAGALRQAAALRSPPDAEGLGMLAWSQLEWAGYLEEDGRLADAEAVRAQLAGFYRALGPALPARPADRRAYAVAHVRYGAEWLPTRRRRNAEVMFGLALALDPGDPATLNDVAWARASRPDSPPADLAAALELAGRAVADAPAEGAYRNTLGVVRYRLGDDRGAVEALEGSTRLRGGGDAVDWYFLAMARHRLGDPEAARRWFEKAAGAQEAGPGDEELKTFRSEAEALLGEGPDPP